MGLFSGIKHWLTRWRTSQNDKVLQGYPPMTLQEHFNDAKITHFKAKEFMTLGGSHSSPDSKGFGLNSEPPSSLYKNITKVAKVCDLIREEAGVPIRVNSCFRNEAYNKAIGGVPKSQHRKGKAADISGPATTVIRNIAKMLRNEGVFQGGIGIYNNFVHIDVRGTPANWDKRK